MASTAKVAPQKEDVPEKEGADTPPDCPLLDLSDVAVRKLIRNAKKRGYVRVDQINSVLPSKEVHSERIEDVLAMFSEMGVNVVQTGEAEPEEEGGEEPDEETEAEANELVEVQQEVPAKAEAKIPTQRPEDPVGIYMLAMRSIKLLSRAGEIAIAKRIEAGREAMIAGLCESPLTFPGHHHLGRRAQRRKGLAARHHRPRSNLCGTRRQGRAEPRHWSRRSAIGGGHSDARPTGSTAADPCARDRRADPVQAGRRHRWRAAERGCARRRRDGRG